MLLPFLLDDKTVNYFRTANLDHLSLESLLATKSHLFTSFNKRFLALLPITINSAFNADHFGYTFTLALRHDVSSNLKIYSNFGVTKDQQSNDISYLGTLELNYNITNSLSAFMEYFGSYADHVSASNGIDIGIIYALKNNIAIDLAFGSPTLNLSLNKFITSGISVRFPK